MDTNRDSNLTDPSEKKEKKSLKIPKDEFPNVFATQEERDKIVCNLPLTKLRKLKKNCKSYNTVTGPYDVQHVHEAFVPFVCGRSISTYPHIPGRPKRDGDPVCDSYCIQILEDNVILGVVADGCNWGKRPMEASNRAKSAFVEYMKLHLGDMTCIREIGYYLLSALSWCHYKIIEGKEDIWEAGTTTLLGGIMVPIKLSKEDIKNEGKEIFKAAFVFVSVGDCKAFHYSKKTKNILDLTKGNRKNVYDARDSGGRLGPYVGEGAPDLRNVTTNYVLCEEEDLILLLSDGVHDNLDPQTLGKFPKDIDEKYAEVTDWKSIITEDEAERLKNEFMTKFLGDDLVCGGEEEKKMRMKVFSFPGAEDDSFLSPERITSKIMHHCIAVTGRGREWMEQNPKEKLPNDYVKYPGKMDHATVVVLRVGNFEKELLKATTKLPKI
jgi:hypothetical protein